MKNVALLAILALAAPAAAEERGLLGLGFEVGSPIGGTVKFWTQDTQAAQFGLGFSGNLAMHGDYVFHHWDLLPPPSEGRLAAYGGLGLRMRNREGDDLEFGLRTPIGAAYWMSRHPLELFAELAPVFKFNAVNGLDLDGVVGLRLYLGKGRRLRDWGRDKARQIQRKI